MTASLELILTGVYIIWATFLLILKPTPPKPLTLHSKLVPQPYYTECSHPDANLLACSRNTFLRSKFSGFGLISPPQCTNQ